MTQDGIMQLLYTAETEIEHFLPEDYEMDDMSWGDSGFIIPIFCVKTMESSMHPVDSFRIFKDAGETDEQFTERFWEKLKEFEESWRDVK